MRIIKNILTITLLAISTILTAQDIHFSQFYNSPLTLNPALTGNINGNIRATLNNRSQWNSIAVPYVTSSVSCDSRFFDERFVNSSIGCGMVIINDQAGEGHFKNQQILINTSYRKNLGTNNDKLFAAGLQMGFFRRDLDYINLTFGSQYENGDFNTNLPNGENFSGKAVSNFDISTGFMYQTKDVKGTVMTYGMSIFHLNKPNESILGLKSRLPRRLSLQYSINYVADDKTNFKGDVLIMSQNKAREILLEGRLEKLFETAAEKKVWMTFGMGYRVADAVVLMTGFAIDRWTFLFSYDVNTSSLHPATMNRGGYEISLIYVNKIIPGKNKLPVSVPCIRL